MNTSTKLSPKVRQTLVLTIFLAVALGVGFAIWQMRRPSIDASVVAKSNGRLEGIDISVAARQTGRVKQLLVEEGQPVHAGQLLLQLDAGPLLAQLAEATAQLKRARAAAVTAEAYLKLRKDELTTAEAGVAQRSSEIVAAESRLSRSEALLSAGGVAAQQLDDDRAQVGSARGALHAAQSQVAAARSAIAAAQSQQAEAKATVEAAAAAVSRVQVEVDDCAVRAPVAGRVEFVSARPGEVAAAGAPLLGLVDTAHLDFVFFLPEQDAGRVALGDDVRIVLDALSGIVLPAKVTYVSSVAQFTPKTVETESERQKYMFRVKARVERATAANLPQLKSGMPGTAYIRRDRTAAWPPQLEIRKSA